ncbi:hypothetical protein [Marinicella meishanensis]|uniref:hypothetical protein n=1 Tax=Marinicella meishanensis TaxID=2873263 RepID=UPI001CBAE610|nr:hypothetical protein [Marinicella sp. NBU2979]
MIDKIIKANHIMFFLASCVLLVMLGFQLKKELFWDSYEAPKVEITQTHDDPKQPTDIEYQLTHVAMIQDLHVFALNATQIVRQDQDDHINHLNMFSGASGSSPATVNLLFVAPENQSRKLFEQDVFIDEYLLVTQDEKQQFLASRHGHRSAYGFLLSKHVYQIVKADTNQDGFLSDADQKDLFISNLDGRNLKPITDNIHSFEVINDNLLLIKHHNNGQTTYSTYDLTTDRLKPFDIQL